MVTQSSTKMVSLNLCEGGRDFGDDKGCSLQQLGGADDCSNHANTVVKSDDDWSQQI